MKIKTNAHGMTMIELIMMIAIGSFVVSGIVLFSRQLTLNVMEMQGRIQATDVARLDAETVMQAAYSAVVNSTTTINGFSVRRRVSTVASNNQQAFDDNFLDTGLVDPDWVMVRSNLKQITIEVDEPGGDFSTPLAQVFTFKQSLVVE